MGENSKSPIDKKPLHRPGGTLSQKLFHKIIWSNVTSIALSVLEKSGTLTQRE